MLHDPSDKPKMNFPYLRYMPHNIRQFFRFVALTFTTGALKVQKEWKFNIEKGYHEHVKDLYGKF